VRSPTSELRWYHYDEPPIIYFTSYDDIMQAIEDGRLDKIIDEHTRYMKETDREIWTT
jgi:predicted transcriptional regulator